MVSIDTRLLTDFENGLNPAAPENSRIPPEILGYGEISSTFMIPRMPGVALKRMPPFGNKEEIKAYKIIVEKYCQELSIQCNIRVPDYRFFELLNQHDENVLYIAQDQLPATGIGNHLLKVVSPHELAMMLQTIAGKLVNAWRLNADPAGDFTVGLDAQISNWHFYVPVGGCSEPFFFDVTTPLMRVDGKEQLDPEIFLKSCPKFLVWLVRWQFLDEVLDRYYDLRQVLIDLVANFYKEGAVDRIPEALAVLNQFFSENAQDLKIEPISADEVQAYYKNDAFIWALFLALRRLDRFITTKLRRKRYNFILPGKIQR